MKEKEHQNTQRLPLSASCLARRPFKVQTRQLTKDYLLNTQKRNKRMTQKVEKSQLEKK